MNEGNFPRPEDLDYLRPRLKRLAEQRGFQLVDFKFGTHTHTYRLGVKAPTDRRMRRAAIHSEVIARCIERGQDTELLRALKNLFDPIYRN